MKKKVTRFLVEVTLIDLALKEFIGEILDDETVYDYKVFKKEDVIVDIEE